MDVIMKLTLYHHNLRSIHEVDSLVEEQILKLGDRLQIDEARVRLECQSELSPAYRVAIHIVTPGPDLQAEGCDHTIRAAIGKALADLEGRLQHREHKPLWRLQSKRQLPAFGCRARHRGTFQSSLGH